MRQTYRAMQVASPGALELVERQAPQAGDVGFRLVLTMESRNGD